MKSRTRMTLIAGASLSLIAVPALAQQGGGQPATPQITMPKSAGKIQSSHGVQIKMPNTAQGGGAGPAQFNSGSSSGGGASSANAAAGGTASGSGTANAAGAGNGPMNVGQSATGDATTTGSIGNGQNAGANTNGNGLAVSRPIQGQQITDLIGMNVLNSKSAQVGTVSNLVMDQKHLAYAVIDVGGGFLGLGDHKIAIPVGKLTLQSNPVVLHTAMTKQQLQNLPAYNAKNYQSYQAGSGGGAGGGGAGGTQAATGNQ